LSLATLGALCGAIAVAQRDGLGLAEVRDLKLLSYAAPSVPTLSVDGSAVVAFTVRADGSVEDAVTLEASDRKLAEPARAAVLRWRFERDPVLGRGRDAKLDAVLRREIVEFVFKRDTVTGMNHREGAKAWFPQDGKAAVRTVLPANLDTPLVRRSVPADPDAADPLSSLTVAGSASVSYVIDETGKARVPIVVAADTPELAAAALSVVARWAYDPPTVDGRPVLVEERNELTFRPRRP
jgi:hypothetical protein